MLIRHFSRQASRLKVDLPHSPLQPIVGLRNRCRIKRVGLDNFCPSLQIRPMDSSNDIGPGQREKIIISLQITRVIRILFPAEILFRQLMTLDHRPHRPVHHDNPLPKGLFELPPTQNNSFTRFHASSLDRFYPLSIYISTYHDISIYLNLHRNLCLGLIRL